ncbi:hypothetical protein GCM10027020_34930 [Nocardioides salsibiostraticola]
MNRTTPAARTLAVLLALFLGLTLALTATSNSAVAAEQGRVRGEILQVGGGPAPTVKVLWFTRDWTYLGARTARGGGYSLSLNDGKYYLQFIDQTPSYDVTKNRPTTVRVIVRAGRTTIKTVKLRRGASLGGQIRAGGRVAKGARVVAANTLEQSFETKADKQGRFALGGLPPGKYSVFTYDRKKSFVAKSLYLGRIKGSRFRSVKIVLNKRAGNLLVDLYAGDSRLRGRPYITAVSRTTGQFWTARAKRGSITFRGLYPGKYYLQVPGVDNYFPARLTVPGAKVRSGRTAFGSVRLTRRGAWVEGTVVDGSDTSHRLYGATVRLLDSSGREVGRTTSGRDGRFLFDGQIATQSGMTVIAGPGPDSIYLDNCVYDPAQVGSIGATAGQRTELGNVAMPRSAGPEQPSQCRPAEPRGEPETEPDPAAAPALAS